MQAKQARCRRGIDGTPNGAGVLPVIRRLVGVIALAGTVVSVTA
jgi:hypothetical protein